MKKIILSSAALLANLAQAEANGTFNINRHNAESYGINFVKVEQAFEHQAEIKLNWEEILSVTADEEGKNINFSTLDGITVIVPVMEMAPTPNKAI